jgi:hypothetical protein
LALLNDLSLDIDAHQEQRSQEIDGASDPGQG